MDRNEPGRRGIARRLLSPDVTWSDARLVRACLNGHEDAWTTLIAKYKNLIYSIPLKYGATPQDAAASQVDVAVGTVRVLHDVEQLRADERNGPTKSCVVSRAQTH